MGEKKEHLYKPTSLKPLNKNNNFVDTLSSHLFWDTKRSKVDPQEHAAFLVQRVLEYGNFEDWKHLADFYGDEQIKNIVVNLRSLEDTALSFICTIYNLSKKEFRCYKLRQSNPHYWNY